MITKSKKFKEHLKQELLGTLMASGPFIGFLLFNLLPMAASLLISFTELRSFDPADMVWNWGYSYVEVVKSEFFWLSLENTLIWLISVPLNMAVSLYLANLLTKHLNGTKFMRTLAFIPSVCSSVGVSLMWKWILDPNFGVVNVMLSWVGIPNVPFTSSAEWFLPSLLLIGMWMKGTNIVLLQSALNNVDVSMKEAARIDGASEFIVFWRVTFPCITPTIFYLLITNIVAAMQEMQIMHLISSDGIGPGGKAMTLSYYIYRMSRVNTGTQGLGMASALSWMVAIVVIIFTRLNFWLSKKWVHYA